MNVDRYRYINKFKNYQPKTILDIKKSTRVGEEHLRETENYLQPAADYHRQTVRHLKYIKLSVMCFVSWQHSARPRYLTKRTDTLTYTSALRFWSAFAAVLVSRRYRTSYATGFGPGLSAELSGEATSGSANCHWPVASHWKGKRQVYIVMISRRYALVSEAKDWL